MTAPRRPDPPKKPQTSVHKKPAPQTGRAPAAAPAGKKRQQMLMIGGAAGGLLIIVLLIVVFSNGKEKGEPKKAEKKADAKEVSPEAMRLESDARKKCDGAHKVAQKVAGLKTAGALEKETLRNEIESLLKQFDEGIELFRKAQEITKQKGGDLGRYESERNEAAAAFVLDLEVDGRLLCDAGKGVLDSKLASLSSVAPDKKDALFEELAKALEKMTTGMALYDRAAGVSRKKADVSAYEGARARGLKELLPSIEREAEASCKSGMELFDTIKGNIGKDLEGAAQERFKADIEKVYKSLKHGLNLFRQANAISGRRYEINHYNQAFVPAKKTYLENK